MSFPGDPEDCSKCVSVSLINSNTRAFGTCGQVNETQSEDTFPWSPSCQEAVGDGMRFSGLPLLSLCGSRSPPMGRSDTLFRRQSCLDVLLLCYLIPPSLSHPAVFHPFNLLMEQSVSSCFWESTKTMYSRTLANLLHFCSCAQKINSVHQDAPMKKVESWKHPPIKSFL